MPERHNTMMTPPIEDLLDRVDSKFTLVTLGSLRAREINSYVNQLGQGLGRSVPPQVTSVAHKPLTIAFLPEAAYGASLNCVALAQTTISMWACGDSRKKSRQNCVTASLP